MFLIGRREEPLRVTCDEFTALARPLFHDM